MTMAKLKAVVRIVKMVNASNFAPMKLFFMMKLQIRLSEPVGKV